MDQPTDNTQEAAVRYTSRRRKGRWLGWISRIETRERGFIFALSADDQREEYFLHCSGTPGVIWDDLQVGDVISCQVADGPRGPRGFDVQKVEDAEVVANVKAREEAHGNR